MNAIPLIQRIVAVLWPAFIMAGIATIVFTTAFDPAVIFIDYDISRFFGAATAAATCYFLKPCQAINKAMQEAEAKRQSADNAGSVS